MIYMTMTNTEIREQMVVRGMVTLLSVMGILARVALPVRVAAVLDSR